MKRAIQNFINLSYNTFLVLGIFIASLSTAKSDAWPVFHPANQCRAALEAQDFAFRTFNDRVKNQATSSFYLVCPVDHVVESGGPDDKIITVYLLNESTQVAFITCTGFGYNTPPFSNFGTPFIGAQDFDAWDSTSVLLGGGEGISLRLNMGNLASTSNNFIERFNLVCLMPPQTSMLQYSTNNGDYH